MASKKNKTTKNKTRKEKDPPEIKELKEVFKKFPAYVKAQKRNAKIKQKIDKRIKVFIDDFLEKHPYLK
jgi:hypothetical protein